MTRLTLQQAFDFALRHHRSGRLREAQEIYQQILVQNPEHSEALHFLGVIAHQTQRNDVAADLIRRSIARQPQCAEAHSNLGLALAALGKADEAIAAHRQAIELRPDYAPAHVNLGMALGRQGLLDESVAATRRAIALRPNFGEAYSNLGIALGQQGLIHEAIVAFRQAIALTPNSAEAHFNLGLALLKIGDFTNGWEEYQWRWKRYELPGSAVSPPWDGGRLDGRTILIHAEQGFGDTIQFVRYLPAAARMGGKIIFVCQSELARLLQPIAGECEILTPDQKLPPFDVHCPLLGLPRAFGTTLADVPTATPYLHANADEVEKWRRRFSGESPLLKVGLAWAGRPAHENDRNRSLHLDSFAPLGQVSGVEFYSLQKGDSAQQAGTPPPEMKLVDWTDDLKDFADTAALIANLDLVITVDTAIAHLAGAMGKSVWTLLPSVADWRWLLDREDSPWYPTMQLFRQASAGDWDSVASKVAKALARLARSV